MSAINKNLEKYSADYDYKDDPFDFIGENKLKTFLIFISFSLFFYFLIPTHSIFASVIVALVSTVFYTWAFSFFVAHLYIRLKNNLIEAREISFRDKVSFVSQIAITAMIAPSFINFLLTFKDVRSVVLIMAILSPIYVIFAGFIMIFLKFAKLYFLAIIIVFVVILSTVFSNMPSMRDILQSYASVIWFIEIVSGVLFPAILINLIFIRIPNLFKRNSLN